MAKQGGLNGINIAQYKGPQEDIRKAEAGQRARANTYATLLKDKSRAQMLSVILGLITLAAVIAMVSVINIKFRVEPFVMRVDATGQEQPLSPYPEAPQKADFGFVHGILSAWIEHVREISDDAVVFGRNWDKVGAFTTTAGLRQLEEFKQDQAKRQRQGIRVLVTIGNIMPIGGKSNSYTVEWKEQAYNGAGMLITDESKAWTGVLGIADFRSQIAKEEMSLRRKNRDFRNVAGVFVNSISWDKEK